ncbi:MAG TPA: hypothetical protein VHZ33_24430 [Trebonia sp.]|nr:hypothetical protein [Trebonia sp.]
MDVRAVTVADLDWVVAVLAERLKLLIPHAPIFWHPSQHAARIHKAYLTRLLTQAGARGYRTDTSVLIAAPSPPGWIVDDASVPREQWGTPDANALWSALTADCSGDPVRFVCPRYEQERGAFAVQAGLTLAESWWLKELPGSQGGQAGLTVELPGASAMTAAAPPVYAPPGPMLLLPEVDNPHTAIPAALAEAPRRGCAGIVINQRADQAVLAAALRETGFRQHCDYYTGNL